MKVLKLPQTVRYWLSKNHGVCVCVCFFQILETMIIYRKIPRRKGFQWFHIKKHKFGAMSSGPFSPDSTKQSQSHVCDCLWNSLFLLRLCDLLIPFRPNCPRNCGRAAHQNVEVVLSNHGLLIFLPNCLQKNPLWLIGWLQNWKTPTHLWFQKKMISGEHSEHQGLDLQKWRKQETDLVQLVPPWKSFHIWHHGA